MQRPDSYRRSRLKDYFLLHVLVCVLFYSGMARAANDAQNYDGWENDARETRETFEKKKPHLRAFFEKSHAYAIYPRIRKVAYAVGVASGRGTVFQRDEVTGFSRLTQVTYGLTLGIHSFAKVIFFRNAEIFEQFKAGKLDLDAQASIVAHKAAAANSYDFDSDVLVFTITNTGLFFDLSLGGQKFTFEPR